MPKYKYPIAQKLSVSQGVSETLTLESVQTLAWRRLVPVLRAGYVSLDLVVRARCGGFMGRFVKGKEERWRIRESVFPRMPIAQGLKPQE